MKKLLLIMIFLLSTSYVMADWCYQESYNITNQTGTDGNCGLNYSGVSAVGGTTFSGGYGHVYYYENWTIPNQTIGYPIYNIAFNFFNKSIIINNTCMTNNNKIMLRIDYSNENFGGATSNMLLACYTTRWNNVSVFYTGSSSAVTNTTNIGTALLNDGNYSSGVLPNYPTLTLVPNVGSNVYGTLETAMNWSITSCEYTSGDWSIYAKDNCYITTPVNLNNNTIKFVGDNYNKTMIDAAIINVSRYSFLNLTYNNPKIYLLNQGRLIFN
jgi:hypothetical protein